MVPPMQLSVKVGGVQFTTAWHDAFALTVMSEGQPDITGLTTSCTITLKVHDEVLPTASVAVYVTIVVPTLKVLPGTLVLVIVPPLQLSVKLGAVQFTTAWHDAPALTVMSDGHPEIRGFIASCTITLKVHVEVLPAASLAVYVTAVVPRLKVVPGARVLVIVPPLQLSLKVGGVQFTTAWHEALVLTVMSERQPEIRGFIASCTMTLKVHVEVFPVASVAVYVTAVVPRLKVVPGARVLVIVPPLQLSLKVGGVQFTTAWQDALALTVMSERQPEITGLIASCTMTLKVHVDVLPAASVAVYVTAVVPMLKVVPGARVLVSVPPLQLSVKLGGVQLTTA